MKLCSFLIPTRNATHKSLMEAVTSIVINCPMPDDYEILLRVDDDDTGRIPFAQQLAQGIGKVVVGPRGRGYNEMAGFVQELVNVADSSWCWLFDDDAWVEGDWHTPLSKLPCTPDGGPAANAQFYCLGESTYPNHSRGGAPGIIMPTAWCKKNPARLPVDAHWLDDALKLGWIVMQLPDVKYHHEGRARV